MKKIDISMYSGLSIAEKIKEANLLASLDSPYIVKYVDSFIENDCLYLITEYCEKGDLKSFISAQMGIPLHEDQIWKVFIQVCIGLAYLHMYWVIHMDLKPQNILIANKGISKLADFGVYF